MDWKTFSGSSIKRPITDEVKEVLHRELSNGRKIKVCIGSDSQVYGNTVAIATVIVFIREKNGGFMFIHKERCPAHFTIKERMMLEVSKSIEVAYELKDVVSHFNILMEVHADINTNAAFKSNIALQEALGYIQGMGFTFKAKPDAFAGSICADRAVH